MMPKRIILGYGIELHATELLSTLHQLFNKFTTDDIDDLILEMVEYDDDKTSIYRYLSDTELTAMQLTGFNIQITILDESKKTYLYVTEFDKNTVKRHEIKQIMSPYFVDLLISWLSANVKSDMANEKITKTLNSVIHHIFQDVKIPVSS